MAKEIERKFIVDTLKWKPQGEPFTMKQAYLVIDEKKIIRVRVSNTKAYLTIKANVQGISRDEFEYEIPMDDALSMLNMCIGNPVEKVRWVFEFEGKTWEVDVFEGLNQGLVVAEIELESEEETFMLPEWAMQEVSTNVDYYNFSLSQKPYTSWQ
jgi:adenylate cyclase